MSSQGKECTEMIYRLGQQGNWENLYNTIVFSELKSTKLTH